MIAERELPNAGSDFANHSGKLVTQYRRKRQTEVCYRKMVIRMTQAGRLDLDQHLPPFRLTNLDLFDLKSAIQCVQNRCFHLLLSSS